VLKPKEGYRVGPGLTRPRNTFGMSVATLLGGAVTCLLLTLVLLFGNVANIDPEQLAIHLIHGAILFQAKGRRH